MSPDKFFEILVEQNVIAGIINTITPPFDSRELRIQNDKLYRMHASKGMNTAIRVAARHSPKKAKKLQAQHDASVFRQLKLVRSLALRTFKHWKRQQEPGLTNREFQNWKSEYDQLMAETIRKLHTLAKPLMERRSGG